MALMITEACTACDACEPVCPNKAISAGNPIYVIDPMKCTECAGAEDEPQCKLVCPAERIVLNPQLTERNDDLLAKYEELHAEERHMSFTNRVSQRPHEEHRATVALMERLEQLLSPHRHPGGSHNGGPPVS